MKTLFMTTYITKRLFLWVFLSTFIFISGCTVGKDILPLAIRSETEETIIEVEESISLNSEEEESIVLFTERELKRAKAYLDKDWRPDETINLAAWEYVSKNPSINNGQENKTLFIESNQVVNATK